MKQTYFHSVTLDKEKCMGCTNCIRRCPTEAIRVRDGKARIIKERCIDCGECIRVCPYHAKQALTDPFSSIEKFKYKIALPAPALYGQFHNVRDINVILNGLKEIGFDDVYEVARAAEIVTIATMDLLMQKKLEMPVISTACPAILRLIRVRFPSLIKNLLPLNAPMDLAAKLARRRAIEKKGIPPEDIGVFFISPCPAKVTTLHEPLGEDASPVDGVIAISEVYKKLAPILGSLKPKEKLVRAGLKGVNWCHSGGEAKALSKDAYLAVDGIDNVISVLESLEDNQISHVEFVEACACAGGCVGGPLTVENGYAARARIEQISKKLTSYETERELPQIDLEDVLISKPIEYVPILKLDDDRAVAMQKMQEMKAIEERLPKLDCGSCGAPSCKALAEDVVRGFGREIDCIHNLRSKVNELVREISELEM